MKTPSDFFFFLEPIQGCDPNAWNETNILSHDFKGLLKSTLKKTNINSHNLSVMLRFGRYNQVSTFIPVRLVTPWIHKNITKP